MKSKLSGCLIEFAPSFKLRLKDQIGTGSFSYVYSTNDPKYVVKMINASDPKSLHSYNNEKYAFQNIKKNENIIECPYFKDSIIYNNINYCCLVLEYCPRGSIISMIVDKKITFQENQILQIYHDVLLGLHHMHSLPKPIAHRDLKGENVLLGEDGCFKLTDFGSISIRRFLSVNNDNRDWIQEDIDKNTTPTIRGPEQCNLYSGLPITERVDIWGLGCLLFILCFHKQPFETKLATVNVQYFISETPKYSKALLNLFPLIFVIDPNKRPNIPFLLNHFDNNFYSLPKGAFLKEEAPRSSIRPQTVVKNPKEKEAQFISSFGDFGKSHLPAESTIKSNNTKVKSSLKAKWKRYIKTLTTKTEAWVLNSLEETEEPPNQKFVRYLIIKAWQKPHKIKKFYATFQKKSGKGQDSTLIVFKTLILLHNYIKKGPNEVYSEGPTAGSSYAKMISGSIFDGWKTVLANNSTSSRDKIRDPYTNKIIVEYASLLREKVDLMSKYSNIIEGNYSLHPFITNPKEDNNPLQVDFVDALLNHLQTLIEFHKNILGKKILWKIQCDLTLSVLDEEFCLVSLLTHLIVALKKSSNYSPSDNAKQNLERLEKTFIGNYQKLIRIFEGIIKMEEFEQYNDVIPFLPKQIVQGVQTIPTFNNYKGKYDAKEHLNTHKSICGLRIPLSYGDLVKQINLDRIIEEEDLPEPTIESINAKVQKEAEKAGSVQTKEKDKNVKEVKNEFQPNFDAFNKFQNFQNFEPLRPSVNGSEGMMTQPDMFAGFNFVQSLPKVEVSSTNQEKTQQISSLSPETPFKEDEIEEEVKAQEKFKNIKLNPVGGEANEPEHKKELDIGKVKSNGHEDRPLTLEDAIYSVGHIVEKEEKASSVEEEKEDIYKQMDDDEENEFNSPPRNKLKVPQEQQLESVNTHASHNLTPQKEDNNEGLMLPVHRIPQQNQNLRTAFQLNTQEKNQGDDLSPSIKEEEKSEKQVDYLNLSGENEFEGLDDDIKLPDYQNINSNQDVDVNPIKSKPEENDMGTFWIQDATTKEVPSLGIEKGNKSPPTQGSLRRNLFLQGSKLDVNKLPLQSAEEEVKLEDPLDDRQNKIAISQKLESLNLPQSHFRGDSGIGIDPEKSASLKSREKSTEKGTPINFENPGIEGTFTGLKNKELLSNYQEKKSYYFSGLTNVPPDEENRNEDPYKEVIESQFESLLGGSKAKQKENMGKSNVDLAAQNEMKNRIPQSRRILRQDSLPKEKKKEIGLVKEEEKEWENIFDINKNSQLQSRRNSKTELPPNLKLEERSLSNQEITTKNLTDFIYSEVSKNKDSWIINYNQLKFLNQIGYGASAKVYKGLWRGTEVAIKQMSLNSLSQGRKKEFEREISALIKLRPHQNLVNLLGVSLHENDLCIITEFCSGGTLFEWLHERTNFNITWKQKVKMAYDIACGMNYLHTNDPPIVHRDLKSLNLLLDGPLEEDSKRFIVKLADFGLAKTTEASQETKNGLTGTFHWMAPEIFDNKPYTVKADVYSFGIVLWEILARETPYAEFTTPLAIMRYVCVEKKRPDLSKVPSKCPKELTQLMVRCWSHEPNERPDFAEILEKLKFLII